MNLKSKAPSDVEISILLGNKRDCLEVFTFKEHLSQPNKTSTISASGIIIDTNKVNQPVLRIKLASSERLEVTDAMLNIFEI